MIDRKKAPIAYPLQEINFPKFSITDLGGTKNCLLIPYSLQPIIFFELILESGKKTESLPGISFFAAKMLAEGTQSLSSAAIADAFESLGSYLEIAPSMDNTSIRLYCLKQQLAPSLDLLKQILFEPVFAESEYDHMRQVRKESLKQQQAKNSQLASIAFNEKLFGTLHPYGYALKPADLDCITIDHVKKYYQDVLFNHAKCVLIGTADQATINQIEEIMNKISAHRSSSHTLSFPATTEWGSHFVEKENSNQASIRVGGFNINRHHPDSHHLKIAMTLLGGFFGSRLMQSIREEKGLTYGISSSVTHFKQASYWTISTEVQRDKTDETLEAIQAEIKKLATQHCSNEELETLKSYMKGNLLSSLDSIFNIGSTYTSLWNGGLGIEFIQALLKTIDSISPAQISEMIDKHMYQPNQVQLVVH